MTRNWLPLIFDGAKSRFLASLEMTNPRAGELVQQFHRALAPYSPPWYRLFALAALMCLMAGIACAQPSASPSPSHRVTIEVLAVGTSWVSVSVDGREVYEGTMRPGQRRTWVGARMARLRAGNAGALHVTYNGRALGAFGRSGQVLQRDFRALPVAPPAPPTPAPEPAPPPPPEPVEPESEEVEPPEEVFQTPSAEPVQPDTSAQIIGLPRYLYVGALAVLLIMSVLLLAAVWRERRLSEEANRSMQVSATKIEVLAVQKIGRGKTLYLIETEGQRFLIGPRGLMILGVSLPKK